MPSVTPEPRQPRLRDVKSPDLPTCRSVAHCSVSFFFQAEDGIRDLTVTGVQTCALPILGSMGSRRGAGPSTTRARSLGSNWVAWQAQKRFFAWASHIDTGHPWWVQIAEYATTPRAASSRVSSVSWAGSKRISDIRFRVDPFRTVFVRGSIG